MKLVSALLQTAIVTLLSLSLPALATAKPKKKAAPTAKSSSAAKPADRPAPEDVKLDDDDDSSPGAATTQAPAEDKPPPVEAEAEAKPSANDSEKSASSSVDSGRPSAFDLQGGLRAVNRSFSYKDTAADLFPSQGYPKLVPFSLPLGPALFVDADFYPGALFSAGAAAHLGLALGYERNFATNAVFAAGSPSERTLRADASQFYAGARVRVPLSVHELSLLVAYGEQTFELAGDEQRPLVPDVHYKFVRFDLGAKLAFGEVFLGGHVGARLVSDTGALKAGWFPNTKAKSFEAGLFAGYEVSRAFDLIIAGDLVRYGFDFNPIPPQTDPSSAPVAGGGLDQYITASLGLRYHVPAGKSSD